MQLEWDMATITAGDYTAEMEIKKETYINWYDNQYKVPGGDYERGISSGYSMKVHLKQAIERYLESELVKK